MKKLTVYCLLLTAILITYNISFTTSAYAAPATSPSQTREEHAISNFKQGNLPAEIQETLKEEDKGFLSNIFNTWNKLTGALINVFNKKPDQPEIMLGRSENLHQSNFPEELKPKQDKGVNPLDWLGNQFQGLLGGSTGFYGADLPKFEEPLEKVSDYEKSYEKSNFPEGINPITGQ